MATETLTTFEEQTQGDGRRPEPTLPPGPGWGPWLETIALWTAPVALLRWCRRRYGRAFTLRAAPMGVGVWLTEAADIKDVFTADPALVHAGEGNAVLGPVLGRRSVLLVDEDEHMRRRKLMLPMFHGDAIKTYSDLMVEVARTEVARWRPGLMRLHPRMQALTLEIIMRAVLGVDRSRQAGELRAALRDVLQITPLRMLLWLKPELDRFPPWKRYRAIQARADRLLFAEIADRRADADIAARRDILSLLVQARYQDGAELGDADIRDQLITLLLAGHETTATGLAWAFERLMRHPEEMRRAIRAADEHDDEHLENVGKEALRCRPVIVDIARRLTREATFAGHLLPAGTIVMPSILSVQESRDWGPHPRAFDPGRWERAPAPAYGWIPFGGGTRRCLGAAFAQMEMRTVLGEVLRTVELRPLTRRGEPERVRHITSVPAFGALARVRRRG
jgi:cytochrome P450 family 135